MADSYVNILIWKKVDSSVFFAYDSNIAGNRRDYLSGENPKRKN